jgi:hypothetical protein
MCIPSPQLLRGRATVSLWGIKGDVMLSSRGAGLHLRRSCHPPAGCPAPWDSAMSGILDAELIPTTKLAASAFGILANFGRNGICGSRTLFVRDLTPLGDSFLCSPHPPSTSNPTAPCLDIACVGRAKSPADRGLANQSRLCGFVRFHPQIPVARRNRTNQSLNSIRLRVAISRRSLWLLSLSERKQHLVFQRDTTTLSFPPDIGGILRGGTSPSAHPPIDSLRTVRHIVIIGCSWIQVAVVAMVCDY